MFMCEDHLARAVTDPRVVQAVKDMIEDPVQRGHVLAVPKQIIPESVGCFKNPSAPGYISPR